MKPSRKGKIVAVANARSAALMREQTGERTIENLEAIRNVSSSLVMRDVPLCPTASLVAETGKIRMPSFPTARTIYNSYAPMLKIWRRAYDDIRNIDSPDPVPLDDLDKIDVLQFEVGQRALVQDLIVKLRELTRRVNALKQLIAESVPTPADDLPPSADEVMKTLSAWLDSLRHGQFDLDDIGVKVSRRSPVGVLIMGLDLFNALQVLVDDYRHAVKARNTTRAAA